MSINATGMCPITANTGRQAPIIELGGQHTIPEYQTLV